MLNSRLSILGAVAASVMMASSVAQAGSHSVQKLPCETAQLIGVTVGAEQEGVTGKAPACFSTADDCLMEPSRLAKEPQSLIDFIPAEMA